MNYKLFKTNPIKPNFSNGRAGACYSLVFFDILWTYFGVLWDAFGVLWAHLDDFGLLWSFTCK